LHQYKRIKSSILETFQNIINKISPPDQTASSAHQPSALRIKASKLKSSSSQMHFPIQREEQTRNRTHFFNPEHFRAAAPSKSALEQNAVLKPPLMSLLQPYAVSYICQSTCLCRSSLVSSRQKESPDHR